MLTCEYHCGLGPRADSIAGLWRYGCSTWSSSGWLALLARSAASKEAELLVLRPGGGCPAAAEPDLFMPLVAINGGRSCKGRFRWTGNGRTTCG